MAQIPLRRRRTKKPSYITKPDQNHWFGKHIVSAITPNNAYQARDCANNDSWTLSGPTIGADTISVSANTQTISKSIPWSTFTEATVFMHIKVDTWNSNDRFFSALNGGFDDIRLFIQLTTGYLLVAWDDGTPTTDTLTTFNDTDEFIVIASHDGSTQRTWLYNVTSGEIESASSSDSCTFSGFDGTTEILGSPIGSASSIDAGYSRFCFIANKAVTTNGQAYSLLRNPWQVLRPQRTLLEVTAAAAASGRIMSSLANYGGLAGHGGLAGKGGGLAG